MKQPLKQDDSLSPIRVTAQILQFVTGLFIGLVLFVSFISFAHAKDRGNDVVLKPISIVRGDHITVGDIFEGAGSVHANHVLAPAPEAGRDMVLNARTLMKIAAAFQINWKPASLQDQIIIRRAATVIDKNMLEPAIAEAVSSMGLPPGTKVELRNLDHVTLPENSPTDFEIGNLAYSAVGDQVTGVIYLPSKSSAIRTQAFQASVKRVVSLPVLSETIRKGDVIKASSLNWIEVAEADVTADMLVDADHIIGTTPRHMVVAGKPILARDLVMPELIKRGDLVTLVFQSGGMTLTAKGKALENAARGDEISVLNNETRKAIFGLVTENGDVLVR